MSRENEETVRSMLEAVAARSEDVAAVVSELWDADGDYYPVRKFPEVQHATAGTRFRDFSPTISKRGLTTAKPSRS
jgi:hypothetical protein